MERILFAPNLLAAQELKRVLLEVGIGADVREAAANSHEELENSFATVWVQAGDKKTAKRIADAFLMKWVAENAGENGAEWVCPKCEMRVESGRTQCLTCEEVGAIPERYLPEAPNEEALQRGRLISRVMKFIAAGCFLALLYAGFLGYIETKVQALSERAYDLHSKSEWDKALGCYNEILEYEPTNLWALIGRGDVYFCTQQHEQSLADLNKVIGIDPNFEDSYFRRGEVYRELGQLKNALSDYQVAQTKDPRNFAYASQAMHCRYFMGDLDGALKDSDQLEKWGVQAMELNFARANVFAERGDVVRARAHAEAAIKADTANANCHALLAGIIGLTDLAAADPAWTEARRLGPDNTYVQVWYGIYLASRNQLADPQFEKVLAMPTYFMNDFESHYLALSALGRSKEAEALVARLDRTGQESRWSQCAIAHGYCLLARKAEENAKQAFHEKALSHLEKAFSLGLNQWKGFQDDWLFQELKGYSRYKMLVEPR